MTTEKRIGKINSVNIGSGGYQDAMFGVIFELGSKSAGWGVGDFWGCWGPSNVPGPNHKWKEEDRQKQVAETFWRLAKLMQEANVNDVADLVGIPIEVEFEGQTRKSWRILTEAI